MRVKNFIKKKIEKKKENIAKNTPPILPKQKNNEEVPENKKEDIVKISKTESPEIKTVAENHQADDRKMRRGLSIHSGHRAAFLADQHFILRCAAQSAELDAFARSSGSAASGVTATDGFASGPRMARHDVSKAVDHRRVWNVLA